MDIQAINENIEELENSDTTFKNVQELAYLYIVKEHLKNSYMNAVESELNDILPQYKEYCKVKKQYQLNEISEDAMVESMKYLCLEIQEFIQALYNNTEMNKERKQIRIILENLYKQYVENY